ncbi:MAG: response regulator transcription factor [Ignavibacteriales bacterium]|nr:response regulator transcription factor [Ignavibacteriales bacterium]
MAHILVIEDEPEMQRGLKDNLEFEGYDVEVIGDGKKGLDALVKNNFDLVLLDVMLPGMSGFDVCKNARAQGVAIPIIMLTAKGEEVDKVLGLEFGADDYITKPFSLRELLARVKAVLRRSPADRKSSATKITLGLLEIDLESYTASKKGKSVSLTSKDFDILRYLWQHQKQVISRDDLLTNVWGYDESISSRTVDNFIVKLRKNIEKDPSHPKHIITVHGTGYKLIP